MFSGDRKSTRLNSSHTVIYTLSLHERSSDLEHGMSILAPTEMGKSRSPYSIEVLHKAFDIIDVFGRSEEHTSELQSHSDLHSFPTRTLFRSGARHEYSRPNRNGQITIPLFH